MGIELRSKHSMLMDLSRRHNPLYNKRKKPLGVLSIGKKPD